MRWTREQRAREPEWSPPDRIPDHDRVFPARRPTHRPERRAGGQWWSPLLGDWLEEPAQSWLEESTQLLPIYELPPDTAAGRRRANGGGR